MPPSLPQAEIPNTENNRQDERNDASLNQNREAHKKRTFGQNVRGSRIILIPIESIFSQAPGHCQPDKATKTNRQSPLCKRHFSRIAERKAQPRRADGVQHAEGHNTGVGWRDLVGRERSALVNFHADAFGIIVATQMVSKSPARFLEERTWAGWSECSKRHSESVAAQGNGSGSVGGDDPVRPVRRRKVVRALDETQGDERPVNYSQCFLDVRTLSGEHRLTSRSRKTHAHSVTYQPVAPHQEQCQGANDRCA